MKKYLIYILFFGLLASCDHDKKILDSLNQYTSEMQTKGFHFGDKIQLPQDVINNAESVSISFGDANTDKMVIDTTFFSLGENPITFTIKKKNGEVLNADALINVYAKTPEVSHQYEIIKEYPHDTNSFTQGFQLEGNTIYESDGQNGSSKLWKYTLGNIHSIAAVQQPDDVFSEGATIVGDKIYQLSWRNKKGFIYDKSTLKLLSEFDYPNQIGEGWGLTYDGKHLLLSDGSNTIYFLNPSEPSKVVRKITVASHSESYDKLNELEYHNGYLYANVWLTPYVLKIDPKTGVSVGRFDFSELAKKNTKGQDDVLNGIAFKGDNMLITGKLWSTIYEVKIR